MSAIAVRQLTVRFAANEVLQGLDLQVDDGEFLVLLGPSGCGKSTLLHSIAGLINVASGAIEIGGVDVTDAQPNERGIGMVFQSYALYPTMTVERNLSFGLRVSGTPRSEIERRVRSVAQMLQLEALLQRKPAQLSGGQRQRVAIGRALVREASVFLLDEPLSNLDAQLRGELRRELKLLHQRLACTMVYVTHDQIEAMTLATRIVVMRSGRIQQIGAPGEVYDRPANLFVAGFIGAPGMNLVHGVVTTGLAGPRFESPHLSLDLGDYAFQVERRSGLPDRPVVLGIRPEHIRIDPKGPFGATVQMVEPMGNHQVIWLATGELTLAVVAHDAQPLAVGTPVRLDVNRQRLSLFDRVSGERL